MCGDTPCDGSSAGPTSPIVYQMKKCATSTLAVGVVTYLLTNDERLAVIMAGTHFAANSILGK